MDDDSSNLSMQEVYDLATDIASEFENVANICGIEALNPLILKVISVLESLEISVKTLETSKRDLADLKNQNLQLQMKKNSWEADRTNLEQDLEELQDSTDKESEQSKLTILKLREDNKRLQDLLQDNISLQVNQDISSDQCLITYLRNMVTSLNAKLEEKDSELLEKINNIVKLQVAAEKLTDVNRALRCKVCEAQEKVQSFCREESDLKQQIVEQKVMLKVMEQSLSQTTKQKLDLEESLYLNQSNPSSFVFQEAEIVSSDMPFTDNTRSELLREQELHLAMIRRLEEALSTAKKESEFFKNHCLQLRNIYSRQMAAKGPCNIRQLFHFVLGVVAPAPENFRSY